MSESAKPRTWTARTPARFPVSPSLWSPPAEQARITADAARVNGSNSIAVVQYDGTGHIDTPAGCLDWLYQQVRGKYANGDNGALADLLVIVEAQETLKARP